MAAAPLAAQLPRPAELPRRGPVEALLRDFLRERELLQHLLRERGLQDLLRELGLQ